MSTPSTLTAVIITGSVDDILETVKAVHSVNPIPLQFPTVTPITANKQSPVVSTNPTPTKKKSVSATSRKQTTSLSTSQSQSHFANCTTESQFRKAMKKTQYQFPIPDQFPIRVMFGRYWDIDTMPGVGERDATDSDILAFINGGGSTHAKRHISYYVRYARILRVLMSNGGRISENRLYLSLFGHGVDQASDYEKKMVSNATWRMRKRVKHLADEHGLKPCIIKNRKHEGTTYMHLHPRFIEVMKNNSIPLSSI